VIIYLKSSKNIIYENSHKYQLIFFKKNKKILFYEKNKEKASKPA